MAKQAKDTAEPVDGSSLTLPDNPYTAKRDELRRQVAAAERVRMESHKAYEAARSAHVQALAEDTGRVGPTHPAAARLAEAQRAVEAAKAAAQDYVAALAQVEGVAKESGTTDARSAVVQGRRLQAHNAKVGLPLISSALLIGVRSLHIEETVPRLTARALPPGHLLGVKGTTLPSFTEEWRGALIEAADKDVGALRRRLHGWVSRGWIALEDLAHLPGFAAVDAERVAKAAPWAELTRPAREANKRAEAAAKAAKDVEAKRKAKDKADAEEVRRRNAEALAAQFAERQRKVSA